MKLTREDIEKGLTSLGLSNGDTVEVHSSLSSFGYVDGGADTIVDALMNVVGKTGALLMSNYPLSPPLSLTAEERAAGIGWKLRKLPEDSKERTTTRAVSDRFRWKPDVVCGSGTHRICAWGKDANMHVKGYQHLFDCNGVVLLLGVDIDRCSSLHLSEKVQMTEKARDRIKNMWPQTRVSAISEELRQRYPADIILGPREEGPGIWQNARDEACRRGLIRKGKIGNAECMLFKIRQVISILEEIRRSGPFQPHSEKKK